MKIPSYDKSAFDGKGDRAPEETWLEVNSAGSKAIEVVIFEGWCVGFQALPDDTLRQTLVAAQWRAAHETKSGSQFPGKLWYHSFENIKQVNEALKKYDDLTRYFILICRLMPALC